MKFAGFISGVILSSACTLAAELRWQNQTHFRRAQLAIPSSGRAGFTQLSSHDVGILFTNTLDEWSAAANRVLLNGSGAACGDYDRDGRPDIFLCSLTGKNSLYRNLGAWKFEDTTAASALIVSNIVCRGAVFADIDGDDWLDLLVSTLGRGVLCFRNQQNGTFTNVTLAAGTETRSGSMSLALADVDGNGTLDLYVVNYRSDDIRDRPPLTLRYVNGQLAIPPEFRDRLLLENGSMKELGEPDALYLNDGHGRFSPVRWDSGRFLDENARPTTGPPRDWGLSATLRDFNGDGAPDLYVCNDYWTPDRFWLNDGKGTFRASAAATLRHTSENSMGVDLADINRDGRFDFFVTDMLARNPMTRNSQARSLIPTATALGDLTSRQQHMRNTLFLGRADGTFAEISEFAGVAASDWSWQPVFIDVDLDGYEDLLIPAGHTRDNQDLDATFRIRMQPHPRPARTDPKVLQQALTAQIMEAGRLYPELPLSINAFRNLGNSRFEDMTARWGTSARSVHQGMALADFDGDGDLDFVVNNLNGIAGLYRNNSVQPRVAVRLRGLPPNTRGIGAVVKLRDGPVPEQMQEMVCGGRYLAGFESLLVFAAKKNSAMTLEVRWRSGKRSIIEGVVANCIYEIDETGATDSAPSSHPRAEALLEDVSNRISHQHREQEFDDFQRQPLLPRKLSQLGPGVAWFDLDGDSHDDLLLGGGGSAPVTFFRNRGNGHFGAAEIISAPPGAGTRDAGAILAFAGPRSTNIVAALSAYEDPRAMGSDLLLATTESKLFAPIFPPIPGGVGPLAIADYDGDRDLDLFIGGRVLAGRYPESPPSFLYRNDRGVFTFDSPNSALLANSGMVSAAVWSDLDLDGWPELVLACEWGPLRIFKNTRGTFTEATEAMGLSHYTGWWNGVNTADLNGDGFPDIIASNWGLNSSYNTSSNQPVRLYHGDLAKRGAVDLIEMQFSPVINRYYIRQPLDIISRSLPALLDSFPTFRSFSSAPPEEVLAKMPTPRGLLEVRTLASMVFLNAGGRFLPRELPPEAQWSPAFAIAVADFDSDGFDDIFLSQNFFAVRPEAYRSDAGQGLLLRGDGRGQFKPLSALESGIEVYGQQRGAAVCDFDEDGRTDLVVTQNGAATRLYRNKTSKAGLRVRLLGTPENPNAIGAVVRLKSGAIWGPAREIHAGAGYWSQDSAVQVLGYTDTPTEIEVRWPGGGITRKEVKSLREIALREALP